MNEKKKMCLKMFFVWKKYIKVFLGSIWGDRKYIFEYIKIFDLRRGKYNILYKELS